MLLGVTLRTLSNEATASRQSGGTTYTIQDLGAIEGYPVTAAYAVNNEGIVVGQGTDPATSQSRAIVYEGGQIRAVVQSEDGSSAASDINDAGQIAGYVWDQRSTAVAMLWVGDKAILIDTLGGDQSTALAINESGQVVGASAIEAGSFEQHALLWDEEGLEDLGTLPGGTTSRATGINADGVIVGSSTIEGAVENGPPIQHPVLWLDREAIDLGLIGGTFGEATDINASGQIVGLSTTGDGQIPFGPGTHAVLWQDEQIIDLGTLAEGESSAAEAINASGVIVGSSMVVAGESSGQPGERHAFVWQNGVMTDLNDLISANAGWEIEYAYDVNDEGAIVGTGILNGEPRAFILTPSGS
jgi:probable HAF family extracellular repeat protein